MAFRKWEKVQQLNPAFIPYLPRLETVHVHTIIKKFPFLTPSQQVPVFIFQLQRHMAVLIDEHYSAKALENMIVVVSNSAQQ
jgi:1-aminocyclopropane-1-carboxylate deaminase/D-cysteine desulfhydrase-like pyridoxal-dependent ACC family enzyme